MATITKLIPFIEKWEGGYQRMKEDRGNYYQGSLIGTNRGITPGAYLTAYGKIPSIEEMKNLSREQFTFILKKLYWDKVKADEIEDQNVANIVVDFAWASGVINAIKRIQRLFKLKDDGIVGAKTLAALNSEGAFEKIFNYRISYVRNIVKNNPTQKKFLKGWENRINDIKNIKA